MSDIKTMELPKFRNNDQRKAEVIVIDRNSRTASGGYDNFPFEELFRNVELLADVPAVEDPDFKKAVTEMVEEKPEGENQAPPPQQGRR